MLQEAGAMPELRKDPIVGRRVIIASERAKRPHDLKGEGQAQGDSGLCRPHGCPLGAVKVAA